jgi:hypothetical protein
MEMSHKARNHNQSYSTVIAEPWCYNGWMKWEQEAIKLISGQQSQQLTCWVERTAQKQDLNCCTVWIKLKLIFCKCFTVIPFIIPQFIYCKQTSCELFNAVLSTVLRLSQCDKSQVQFRLRVLENCKLQLSFGVPKHGNWDRMFPLIYSMR